MPSNSAKDSSKNVFAAARTFSTINPKTRHSVPSSLSSSYICTVDSFDLRPSKLRTLQQIPRRLGIQPGSPTKQPPPFLAAYYFSSPPSPKLPLAVVARLKIRPAVRIRPAERHIPRREHLPADALYLGSHAVYLSSGSLRKGFIRAVWP